jgi:hypothetical protein
MLVTRQFGEPRMAQVFERIQNLEKEAGLDWLAA